MVDHPGVPSPSMAALDGRAWSPCLNGPAALIGDRYPIAAPRCDPVNVLKAVAAFGLASAARDSRNRPGSSFDLRVAAPVNLRE